MKTITTDQLKELLDSHWDGVLVEVLPAEYYREYRLPGAIHLPFDEHFEEHARQALPDLHRQIVVYCLVRECTASNEAGRRLEEIGYTDIWDYEEGKSAWRAAGLPIESEHIETHR